MSNSNPTKKAALALAMAMAVAIVPWALASFAAPLLGFPPVGREWGRWVARLLVAGLTWPAAPLYEALSGNDLALVSAHLPYWTHVLRWTVMSVLNVCLWFIACYSVMRVFSGARTRSRREGV